MKEKEQSFLEFASETFHNFSQTVPGSTRIIFSKKTQFPIMKFESEMEIMIPLPRKQGEKYVFEGMIFDNDQSGRRDLFCLFLATLYHIASHVCVTNYSVYDQWKKHKTRETCLRVMDFIEDVLVEKYISHMDLETWENMKNINSKLVQREESKCQKRYNLRDSHIRGFNNENSIAKIRLSVNNKPHQEILPIADLLYKNRDLLPDRNLPYYERHSVTEMLKTEEKCPEFEPFGVFREKVEKLEELWSTDEQFKAKLLKRYEKHLKSLNFDRVVIPGGNFHNFVQIREKVMPLLRKIRQQVRMVANVEDEPSIDKIGYVDLQMAIQAIASEGQSTDIFERNERRRVEEAWAIVIDKSASMNLRFDEIKEFTVCVAEAANELTGKSDAWALYSFDSSFQILKDFKEKYGREVQARIGALENSGLSLLPDAIELSSRMLSEDPREKKYIFVITDGHPSGYERINQQLSKIVKRIEASDMTLIAIGVSKKTSKRFRNNVRGSKLKTLVAKFITAYRISASDDV